MPGSRLLPTEQRSTLPVAPTTSRWWRIHVLFRSWLNGHRHRWLAPLLVCVPPVGVAMVWAGATRPGHQRRWLTAAAGVWMIVLGLLVSLLALPGASPADAGGAPPRAGGPVVTSPTSSASPRRDDAAKAAVVRSASTAGGGVSGAAVATTPAAGSTEQGGSSDSANGSDGSASGSTPHTSSAPNTPSKPSATPKPTRPTPTPTPPGTPPQPPHHPVTPPTVPTASPLTRCSVEGAHAVSPNGFPLRCDRTPIGLYWLWGQ